MLVTHAVAVPASVAGPLKPILTRRFWWSRRACRGYLQTHSSKFNYITSPNAEYLVLTIQVVHSIVLLASRLIGSLRACAVTSGFSGYHPWTIMQFEKSQTLTSHAATWPNRAWYNMLTSHMAQPEHSCLTGKSAEKQEKASPCSVAVLAIEVQQS